MSAALAAVLAELADPAPPVPAPDWTAALCAQADPEAWFPEKGGSTYWAKRVCNGAGTGDGCPLRVECLTWAVVADERYGVWGGLSEQERRPLRRCYLDTGVVPAPGVRDA